MSGETQPNAHAVARALLLKQPEDRVFEVVGGVLVERDGAPFEHGHAQLRIGASVGPYDRPGA